MKVNFLTSGFPEGFTDEFINEFDKYNPQSMAFAFIASDFSLHEKTREYMEIISRNFREMGISFVKSNIIDYKKTREEAVNIIQNSDVVWIAGGPTLTQIRYIKEYGLAEALQKRDGITIGMSAGSINMAKRVVLAKDIRDGVPELSIYDGIGLVDINIEPHIGSASEEHIKDIEEAAKTAPIYGLYDESFIVETDGIFNIHGKYRLFI